MLDDRKMRPTHVVRFAPMAIEMVFLPSDSELLARAVKESQVARQRKGGTSELW